VTAGERWDYIVVGAGAAGCVLANRLTACGRHRGTLAKPNYQLAPVVPLSRFYSHRLTA